MSEITIEELLNSVSDEIKAGLKDLAESSKMDATKINAAFHYYFCLLEQQVKDFNERYKQALQFTSSQLESHLNKLEEDSTETKKTLEEKPEEINTKLEDKDSSKSVNLRIHREKILKKLHLIELSEDPVENIGKAQQFVGEYLKKFTKDVVEPILNYDVKEYFKFSSTDFKNIKAFYKRVCEEEKAAKEAKETEKKAQEEAEKAKWEQQRKENQKIKEQEELKSRLMLQGCFVPTGYKISDAGAFGAVMMEYHTKEGISEMQIANCKAMVTGRFKSLDSDSELVELMFTAPNTSNSSIEWRTIRVPFEATKTIEGFKKDIIPKGFDASGKGINATIDYFEACTNANFGVEGSAFKCSNVFDSTGWKDERCTMFVAGNRMYYDDNGSVIEKEVIFTNDGVAKSLTPHGTLEGWLEAIKYVACFERVRYVMYESLASALLTPLGVSPHTDAIVGSTSQGKTTATQAGASQIGNPDDKGTGIILSGDLTVAGANAMLKTYRDLPTYFDETTGMKEAVKKVFGYVVGNGQESIRSNQNGTARERKSHNTIAFATAEESLVSEFANDGADVRIITLKKRMIPENSQSLVDAAKTGMKAHYGHILKLFIAKIFQHRHELSGWFEMAKTRLANMTTEDRMKRKATYFACAEVAGILLEEIFDEIGVVTKKNPIDIINLMWRDAIDDQEKPMVIRALQCTYEFIIAATNQHFIVNDVVKDGAGNLLRKGDIYGWVTDGTFDINKKQLDKELIGSGFTNLKSIYESWYNSRIIIKNDKEKEVEKEKEKDRGYTTKVYHFVSVDALRRTQFRAISLSKYHVYKGLDMDTSGLIESQPESNPATSTVVQSTGVAVVTPSIIKPLVW